MTSIVKPGKFGIAFYRGTRPGIPGAYNWFVRKWEDGPFSHCEMVFSDGLSASASFADGGVRFKHIDYHADRWEFVELPAHLEPAARAYFALHEGESYDLIGNVHFLVGFIRHSEGKKFCSEACAGALGILEPWRYGPNALYPIVLALSDAWRNSALQYSQR